MDGLDSVELIRDLTLNLVSIFVLVFMIYFRRHRRWDQVVGYVAFNISLFTVSAALGASGPINVGVGFGLFAVLSVVRLRSEESGQFEIGFTMVALVLGLKIIFASVLVVTMFFIDIVSLGGKSRYQRIKIELDVVINDESDLISHLEKTFSRRVQSVNIRSIDVVRDIMVIDVLFRSPK